MKYIVLDFKVQPIPSLGKEKKVLSLQDEQGNFAKADIWSDFPSYPAITVNSEVEGDLVPPKDPKYNATLRAPRTGGTYRKPAGNALAIGLAQDKKIENIKNAQDNKEKGIRIASSFRDATLIMTTMYADKVMEKPPEERSDFIKSIHKQVRDWYLSEWDNEDGTRQIPF